MPVTFSYFRHPRLRQRLYGACTLAMFVLAAGLFVVSSAVRADECRVRFSRPDIHYGHIPSPVAAAPDKQVWPLDSREVRVVTLCDSARLIADAISGPRHLQGFLFGSNSTVLVTAHDATLDGHPVHLGLLTGHSGFLLKQPGRQRRLLHDGDVIAPVREGRLARGKLLAVTLQLQPLLSEQDAAPRDGGTLDAGIRVGVLSREDD